jgi:hypothetical protein
MLAEFLEGNRDQLVRSVEPRAAAEEPLGLPSERHSRLETLLEDLIQALRYGGMDGRTLRPTIGGHSARQMQ